MAVRGSGSEWKKGISMRKNSIKNTRINGEVQKELSVIIQNEIKDPRIAPNTLAGLKSAEGYIRRQLARTVNLRNTPEIRFILDQSIEYGVTMTKLIDDVLKTERRDEGEHEQDAEA